jgi:hypothetical protein
MENPSADEMAAASMMRSSLMSNYMWRNWMIAIVGQAEAEIRAGKRERPSRTFARGSFFDDSTYGSVRSWAFSHSENRPSTT